MAEPRGGDHLEEVVTQREGVEGVEAGQRGRAQCEDTVVREVQAPQ